jgi:hypothetical protein
MAGDWIKLQHTTPDKPEVIRMAEILGIDQDAVVGKLCRIWIWADQQTINGNADCNGASVTDAFIDRITNVSGFSKAIRDVGWLATIDGRTCFPNFAQQNGQTAKARAVANTRVAKHRAQCNAERNGASVTDALPKPLPEKRREDSTVEREYLGRGPSLELVKERAKMDGHPLEEAEAFWNHFQAVGWVNKHGQPIRDWVSRLASWVRNAQSRAQEARSGGGTAGGGSKRPLSVGDLRTILQAKEDEARGLKDRHCSQVAMGDSWSPGPHKEEYFKLRREIKEMRKKIANLG